MFTVCPKCALTLVVTAADLRVAQGYVRCGRCSNVFNALARLSEDRQAATATAQTQAADAPATTKTAATGTQARPDSTFKTRQLPDPAATGRTRQVPDPAPARNPTLGSPEPVAATKPLTPPPPSEPKRYGDDTILDEDLEFNPEATDITKVFVEQAPSPRFTEATGTFKALRAESGAEDPAPAEPANVRQTQARHHAEPDKELPPFDPVDTQVDVEIDSDLLDAMAELTGNRLPKIDLSAPPPTPPLPTSVSVPSPVESYIPPTPVTQTPAPAPAPAPQRAAALAKAPPAPPPAPPPKSAPLMQPPLEQPPQAPAPMRLAERAKARVEAAKPASPVSIETAQAIRAALLPRKRSPAAAGTTDTASSPPTSFFAGMWTAGSVLLLLLLAGQVVHHYRHDLAATQSLNGPLTSVYAVLGIPLIPRWNLEAYEVRQLGASTAAEAPGQITVRASVKNGAHQPQPLPLLRVTLQDRFGNRIAARDVPPQSYLPRAIPASSLLSAGQRIDAEMAFVDPGSNAVGFEIDACLPAPDGGIACANDAARQ
jgi:predicted Zn finger-like uncharacterized protein